MGVGDGVFGGSGSGAPRWLTCKMAKLNLYAYDAYIINCAIQHHAPLISLDRKLLAAADKAGAAVVEMTP